MFDAWGEDPGSTSEPGTPLPGQKPRCKTSQNSEAADKDILDTTEEGLVVLTQHSDEQCGAFLQNHSVVQDISCSQK